MPDRVALPEVNPGQLSKGCKALTVSRSAVAAVQPDRPRHLLPQVKVLLVGDDAAFLAFYRDVFEGLRLKVSMRTSPASALACLERGAFGLIVVNQRGPAFESRLVLEQVAALDRRPPVVVVTSQSDSDSQARNDAQRLGALAYFEEPVPVPVIVDLVKICLACDLQREVRPGLDGQE